MDRGAVLQRLRAISRPIVKAVRGVWWVIRHGPPAFLRWLKRHAPRAIATLWLAGLAAFVVLTGWRSFDRVTAQAALARDEAAEREQVQAERREQLSKLEYRDIDEMEEARDKKLAELGIFEMPEKDDSLGECMLSPDEVTKRMRAVAKIRAGEKLTVDDRKALQPPDPKTCVRAPKDEDEGGKKKKGLAGWIARNRKHMNRPVSDAMTLELLQKELKGFKKEPGDPAVSVDESGNLVVVAAAPGESGSRDQGDAGEGAADEQPADDDAQNQGQEPVAAAESVEAADGDAADEGAADEGAATGAASKLRPGRRGKGGRAGLVVVGRVVRGVDGPALGRAALGALVPAVIALSPEQPPTDDGGGDKGETNGAADERERPDQPAGPTKRERMRAVAEALVVRAGPRDLELAAAGEALHVLLPADTFHANRTARVHTNARWLVIDIGDVLAEHEGLVVRVVGDPVPEKGQRDGVDPARSRKRAELVAQLLAEGGLTAPVEVEGLTSAEQAPHGDRVTIVVAAEPLAEED